MAKHKFEEGNSGRPKGSKGKTTFLKYEIAEAFKRNRAKGRRLLNEMFNNKQDFKWLMELQAGLEPKELNHSGEIGGEVKLMGAIKLEGKPIEVNIGS